MSVIESVAADLRRRILAGNLVAGSAIGERDVAERYEVARPTAKRAIETLVDERLLERGAHRTARVVRLAPHEAYDIYRTREVIEAAAVRHLAQARSVPADSVAANAEIAALVGSDPREIVGPDMRFHAALVRELGSDRLQRMYDSLVSEVVLCMTQIQGAELLPTDLIHAEHERLLDLIRTGDEGAAAALLAEHVGRARDRLVIRLTQRRP